VVLLGGTGYRGNEKGLLSVEIIHLLIKYDTK
jgi:hypothetical protein